MEELTDHFLAFLEGHADPFLRAIAEFERALLQAWAGSDQTCEIYFDRNPDLAFQALEQRGTMPSPDREFRYRMTVDRHLPGMFRCTREEIEAKTS